MSAFSEIIGHEKIIEYFKRTISQKHVVSAYILQGEDHSGKLMLANSIAKALVCKEDDADGCGECHDCRQAESRNHPDIIYVGHDRNAIRVDDIRSQINDTVAIKPYSADYKIYIVDEAEKMNVQAQNALLKTLEEPPEYVVIILLAENDQVFLPTILSRCITMRLQPVPDETIAAYLRDHFELDEHQVDICTSFAQGKVGKAIDLATSDEFAQLMAVMLDVVTRIDDMDEFEFGDIVKSVSEYKLQIYDFFDLMMIWYRDVLYYKATADVNKLVFKDKIYDIKRQSDKSSYNGLERIIKALETARARIRANVNFDLTIELLLQAIKEN